MYDFSFFSFCPMFWFPFAVISEKKCRPSERNDIKPNSWASLRFSAIDWYRPWLKFYLNELIRIYNVTTFKWIVNDPCRFGSSTTLEKTYRKEKRTNISKYSSTSRAYTQVHFEKESFVRFLKIVSFLKRAKNELQRKHNQSNGCNFLSSMCSAYCSPFAVKVKH